ncbi:unnamed protein product [Cyprideis torosa]|uniref:Uncharacterized protein n=1 Tax=Cyprideis torosa TaxID=163714 RepID=A0A7R8W8W9_9CRUS|nr:unnamed protein product [Cyprideis torosa]CAG0889079.1 unnamed protein product [Cyprideis torosa]
MITFGLTLPVDLMGFLNEPIVTAGIHSRGVMGGSFHDEPRLSQSVDSRSREGYEILLRGRYNYLSRKWKLLPTSFVGSLENRFWTSSMKSSNSTTVNCLMSQGGTDRPTPNGHSVPSTGRLIRGFPAPNVT